MTRNRLTAALAVVALIGTSASANVSSSLRPHARPASAATASTSTDPAEEVRTVARSNARFDAWLRQFRSTALKNGISASTYDRAVRGIDYNAKVIERDRNQTEFTKQIWEYLDIAASDDRVRNGQRAYAERKALLSQIERRYGVDARVVVAIWGLESAYGARRGDINVIEALATLAFDSRRSKFFRAQLIAALKILENGDTTPNRMYGSWAGAMGHTQFIPTSYLAFAADFRGDGRRDIWSDDPTDALASTANYLKEHGWRKGQPWGVEVKLPKNFDYRLTGERVRKPVSFWAAQGVTLADGRPLVDYGPGSIRLPGGSAGAAFLTFDNFKVIERYNPADAYVIGVGHLGDRIMGGPEIRASWPRGEQSLSFREKKELQRRLRRKGFELEKIDGIIGPNTIAAIRAYQTSIGRTADGFATKSLLNTLR